LDFHLIYWGSLKANGGLYNAHEIRKFLHPQLKALWKSDHRLQRLENELELFQPINTPGGGLDTWLNVLSRKFSRCGLKFVPLVTKELRLACRMEILLLTREEISPISGTDIDNRLKTLFDALRVPTECDSISKIEESPFFCLLEDDRLITDVRVSTAKLLLPDGDIPLPKHVVLIMNVHVYPTSLSQTNLGF
jgi:hypothetical protein